ncbi:MAG: copper resistance protein CopC [Pseudomonadota bacterium]
MNGIIRIRRRSALAALFGAGFAAEARAQSDGVRVLDSAPKAQAVVGRRSSAFYVRFDRPIDHASSRLWVSRDGTRIEELTPNLDANPDVLFARAPTLVPGDYTLHWLVTVPKGVKDAQGSIPFSVTD